MSKDQGGAWAIECRPVGAGSWDNRVLFASRGLESRIARFTLLKYGEASEALGNDVLKTDHTLNAEQTWSRGFQRFGKKLGPGRTAIPQQAIDIEICMPDPPTSASVCILCAATVNWPPTALLYLSQAPRRTTPALLRRRRQCWFSRS